MAKNSTELKNAINTKVDLTADDLVECLLKREGGTTVDFGFHNRKKVKYHFAPLDVNDPDSPHVCNVPNEEHYDRFVVGIPEAYRPYDHDAEYEPAMSMASASSGEDNFDPSNDENDLLSVNPEEVSNKWLGDFAKNVLKTPVTQKQKLADLATEQYGLEFDYSTTTATDIVRLILVERIKEEKNASDAAE